MKRLLFIFALAVPALAQEPSRKITPADPVSVTAHTPICNVSDSGDPAKAAPVLPPTALPPLKKPLGTVARELRAAHATEPKAKTVANDEQPIEQEDKI